MASILAEELEPRQKASLSSYQTALAILLPSSCPYYKDISTLRSLYDKNSEIWPPHINLLYPFVAPESIPNAIDTIQKYLTSRRTITSVTVNLDTAGIWEHKDHATVYLGASAPCQGNGSEQPLDLLGLRKELLSLLSAPPEVVAREYTPHLTIGQTAPNEEVMMGLLGKAQKLVANAGGGGIQWDTSRLMVLQRGAAKSGMRVVSEIVLGRQPVVGGSVSRESPDSEQDSSQRSSSHHVYVFSDRTYVPYTPVESNPPSVQALTVATYNTFADSAIPTAMAKSRYPLLLSAILSTTASVLNLQEITDDFLAYLLSQSEIQRRFPYSTHSLSHGILPSWRNCVTLASYPLGDQNGMWEFVELGRHKGAVVVELNFIRSAVDSPVEGKNDSGIPKVCMKKRLVIANVHLTCGISDGASAAKVTQMRILSSYFLNRTISQDSLEVWTICGDFNIPTSHSTIHAAYDSQEISQETYKLLLNTGGDGKRVIPEMWKDTYTLTHSVNGIADTEDLKFDLGEASGGTRTNLFQQWEPTAVPVRGNDSALGPGEFGATFNPFTNRLCTESVKCGANPRPQRYDRILVSHNGVGGEQNWIEVVNTGRFGLEGGSDHWGLYAEIRVQDSTMEMKGTKLGRRTWLKLEPRVEAKDDMNDEALEKYLYNSGMIPSQKDYTIREEAKSVLTMVLTGEVKKYHEYQIPPPIDNSNLTPMPHSHTPTQDYRESIVPPVSLTQRVEQPQVKIIAQTVGSYYMNLFTPTSDVDILCASNISARIFWALVKQKIRRHNRKVSEAGGRAGRIRILRTVEAQSGTMMELEYVGGYTGAAVQNLGQKSVVETADIQEAKYEHCRVRIDLQYCQVPARVLDKWVFLSMSIAFLAPIPPPPPIIFALRLPRNLPSSALVYTVINPAHP